MNMLSELIDQLKKCSDLVKMGAISQDVFRDLQSYQTKSTFKFENAIHV